MNGKIYKVAPRIFKEEIVEGCKFEEIPDYGRVMSYKEFASAVDSWCIMDYDGCGELILYDKVVADTSTWIYNRTVHFENRFFVPFDVLYSIFGDDMKIIWFNK